MTCRTDSPYRLTRWNAARWFTRREGIMPCLGDRCRYRFCGLADPELPTDGSGCPWEVIYVSRLLQHFDQTFPCDGLGQYLDDYDYYRKEWVVAHLLANRASVRASITLRECFHVIASRGAMPYDRRPFTQYEIAERYRTSARNRVNAVWDQLYVVRELVREDRIESLLIFHGYWRPSDGRPVPSEVPQWIVQEAER